MGIAIHGCLIRPTVTEAPFRHAARKRHEIGNDLGSGNVNLARARHVASRRHGKLGQGVPAPAHAMTMPDRPTLEPFTAQDAIDPDGARSLDAVLEVVRQVFPAP